ncbi:PREDICTED: protein cordon-bleu-like isoform X2 [Branchiostoma belcheri]|uniref:Protein cordon-bleu-like isoform X2 n=1 Tax=Branchiostoma belcheri TaxID=7741 RepID=A0A6P4Z316_BRABE|nr:PREDICTED: protein cordon-bleu-like isoform X2 [Branchiostoma belcheri]
MEAPVVPRKRARAPPPPPARKPHAKMNGNMNGNVNGNVRPSVNGLAPGKENSHVTNENVDPVQDLDGFVDLDVILPGGEIKTTKFMASTHMMDLLVQICAKYKRQYPGLSPSSHTMVIPPTEDGEIISYMPSTPIGRLPDVTQVVVRPKNEVVSEDRDRWKPVQPKVPSAPERTFRLVVNLPQNQKTFVRVSRKLTVAELYPVICEKCNMDPARFALREVDKPEVVLDTSRTLEDYNMAEVLVVDTRPGDPRFQPSPYKSPSRPVSAYDEVAAYKPAPLEKSQSMTSLGFKDKVKKSLFSFGAFKNKRKFKFGFKSRRSTVSGEIPYQLGDSASQSSSHQYARSTSFPSTQSPPSPTRSLPQTPLSDHPSTSAQPPVEVVERRKKRPPPPPPGASKPGADWRHSYAGGDTTLERNRRKPAPRPPQTAAMEAPYRAAEASPTRETIHGADSQASSPGAEASIEFNSGDSLTLPRSKRRAPPPPPGTRSPEVVDGDLYQDDMNIRGYNTLPAKPPRPMSYAAPGDLSLEFRPATFDIPPPPDIPPPDVPPSPSPREEEVKMEEEEEDEAVAMLAPPSEYGEASSAATEKPTITQVNEAIDVSEVSIDADFKEEEKMEEGNVASMYFGAEKADSDSGDDSDDTGFVTVSTIQSDDRKASDQSASSFSDQSTVNISDQSEDRKITMELADSYPDQSEDVKRNEDSAGSYPDQSAVNTSDQSEATQSDPLELEYLTQTVDSLTEGFSSDESPSVSHGSGQLDLKEIREETRTIEETHAVSQPETGEVEHTVETPPNVSSELDDAELSSLTESSEEKVGVGRADSPSISSLSSLSESNAAPDQSQQKTAEVSNQSKEAIPNGHVASDQSKAWVEMDQSNRVVSNGQAVNGQSEEREDTNVPDTEKVVLREKEGPQQVRVRSFIEVEHEEKKLSSPSHHIVSLEGSVRGFKGHVKSRVVDIDFDKEGEETGNVQEEETAIEESRPPQQTVEHSAPKVREEEREPLKSVRKDSRDEGKVPEEKKSEPRSFVSLSNIKFAHKPDRSSIGLTNFQVLPDNAIPVERVVRKRSTSIDKAPEPQVKSEPVQIQRADTKPEVISVSSMNKAGPHVDMTKLRKQVHKDRPTEDSSQEDGAGPQKPPAEPQPDKEVIVFPHTGEPIIKNEPVRRNTAAEKRAVYFSAPRPFSRSFDKEDVSKEEKTAHKPAPPKRSDSFSKSSMHKSPPFTPSYHKVTSPTPPQGISAYHTVHPPHPLKPSSPPNVASPTESEPRPPWAAANSAAPLDVHIKPAFIVPPPHPIKPTPPDSQEEGSRRQGFYAFGAKLRPASANYSSHFATETQSSASVFKTKYRPRSEYLETVQPVDPDDESFSPAAAAGLRPVSERRLKPLPKKEPDNPHEKLMTAIRGVEATVKLRKVPRPQTNKVVYGRVIEKSEHGALDPNDEAPPRPPSPAGYEGPSVGVSSPEPHDASLGHVLDKPPSTQTNGSSNGSSVPAPPPSRPPPPPYNHAMAVKSRTSSGGTQNSDDAVNARRAAMEAIKAGNLNSTVKKGVSQGKHLPGVTCGPGVAAAVVQVSPVDLV